MKKGYLESTSALTNQSTRIAKRRLIEPGWAYSGALVSKVILLARNRVISSVLCFEPEDGVKAIAALEI